MASESTESALHAERVNLEGVLDTFWLNYPSSGESCDAEACESTSRRSRTPPGMPELVPATEAPWNPETFHDERPIWLNMRSISEAYCKYFEGKGSQDPPYPRGDQERHRVTWVQNSYGFAMHQNDERRTETMTNLWWQRVVSSSKAHVKNELRMARKFEKSCAEAVQREIERYQPSAKIVAELAKNLKTARYAVDKATKQLNQFEDQPTSSTSSTTRMPPRARDSGASSSNARMMTLREQLSREYFESLD